MLKKINYAIVALTIFGSQVYAKTEVIEKTVTEKIGTDLICSIEKDGEKTETLVIKGEMDTLQSIDKNVEAYEDYKYGIAAMMKITNSDKKEIFIKQCTNNNHDEERKQQKLKEYIKDRKEGYDKIMNSFKIIDETINSDEIDENAQIKVLVMSYPKKNFVFKYRAFELKEEQKQEDIYNKEIIIQFLYPKLTSKEMETAQQKYKDASYLLEFIKKEENEDKVNKIFKHIAKKHSMLYADADLNKKPPKNSLQDMLNKKCLDVNKIALKIKQLGQEMITLEVFDKEEANQ